MLGLPENTFALTVVNRIASAYPTRMAPKALCPVRDVKEAVLLQKDLIASTAMGMGLLSYEARNHLRKLRGLGQECCDEVDAGKGKGV